LIVTHEWGCGRCLCTAWRSSLGRCRASPNITRTSGLCALISTSTFLVSPLAASILGAGIGILGFTALFVYLVRGSHRPGIALAAFVATVVKNMGLVALFGVAAFAQRAIGKAHLAWHHDVVGVNSSVYGAPLVATSVVGFALFFVGVILFAIAISGSESLPRPAGVLLGVAIPVFSIGSLLGDLLGSTGALVVIGSTIWIARSTATAVPAVD
jgi:hypothetical protein